MRILERIRRNRCLRQLIKSADGLRGDEIPISAQVVSVADVYDALVSERVYKKAISHEKAIEMILNGECGVFNPILMECLVDIKDKIHKESQLEVLR